MQITRKRVLVSSLFTLYSLFSLAFLFSSSSASTLATSGPSSPFSCETVNWINATNVSISGSSIQKSGGAPSTWDAGAASSRAILSGDGYVQVTVDTLNSYRMFGLSNGDTDTRYPDIDFAFYITGSVLKVYERGLTRTIYSGSLSVGDNLSVSVESGVVNYYRNGALIYVSSATPIYPLLLDTSINSMGGQIYNAFICGTNLGTVPTNTPAATSTRTVTPTPITNCQPVIWMNTTNLTATDNSIQKTGGTASTWDAGAVSTMAILSGDGYVQATVDTLNSYRMFGLSNGDTDAGFRDIDFAAYMAGSNLMVYERGLYRGTVTTLSVGDTIRVAVESGVVKYYLNGAPVYVSAASPTYPLLLDTSINSSYGRITNASICGANLGPNRLASPTPTNTSVPATSTSVATNSPTNTRTNSPTSRPTDTATTTPTSTATFTYTPTNTRRPTNTRTATRTPTTQGATWTPAPTNTPGGTGGCAYFPANNIWNRNIASLPVHPMSAQYVASIGLNASLHANFGSGTWDGGPIGMPFVTVPGTQPRVPMNFTYWTDSDPGPYPIPTDVPIEGGPNSTGDRHVFVVDRDACVSYEVYNAYPNSDGSWDAGSGARFNLNSNALRPDGWTSGDAAGLPIVPALVTYDQVQSGVIRHALRFSVPSTQSTHIWPARHHSQGNTDTSLPPMGLRVRLKASTNISGYSAQVQVILQAMKDYGMFIADNGGPWQFDGTPDERWNNNVLHQLDNLQGSDFEAVDESSLMIDPNSGQSR